MSKVAHFSETAMLLSLFLYSSSRVVTVAADLKSDNVMETLSISERAEGWYFATEHPTSNILILTPAPAEKPERPLPPPCSFMSILVLGLKPTPTQKLSEGMKSTPMMRCFANDWKKLSPSYVTTV